MVLTERIHMNVMEVARSIGLTADDRGEMFGTIDETVVLTAIEALAGRVPGFIGFAGRGGVACATLPLGRN